jgi:hypothetical protein
MSHYYSPKHKFRHTFDCTPTGCPGHVMFIDYASTYDGVHVYIDDKLCYTFDDATWCCLQYLSKLSAQGKVNVKL